MRYVADNWFKKSASEISRDTKLSEKTIRNYAKAANLPSKKGNLFQEILNQNNFNPPKWKDGWLKTEEASIRIVNSNNDVSLEQIKEEMIKEMKKHSPKYPKIKRIKSTEHLLVISLGDIHFNKLALFEETGEEYNIEIAVKRVKEAINEILIRSIFYKPELIMLCIGNDSLHTDTAHSTTKGTLQDTNTAWHRAYKIARQTYVEVIEQLLTVSKVHIVFNPSNHDYYSGFMLADSLFCWFNKCRDITFDISIKHRKYFKYGENLIGTTHGDEGKIDDYPMLMATEAKEDWATTSYRYIFCHHIHHKKQIKFLVGHDKQQVEIEYMRSPSAADGWHYRSGYIAQKSIEGFIHSKKKGQISRLRVNF